MHCSGTLDRCNITWDRLRTVSCSSLQFSVSLTLPDGTSVYNESFDQSITSTPTVPLDPDTVYSVAITAGSICGSTTCSANCFTASLDSKNAVVYLVVGMLLCYPISCSITLNYEQVPLLILSQVALNTICECIYGSNTYTLYWLRVPSYFRATYVKDIHQLDLFLFCLLHFHLLTFRVLNLV